MRVVGNRKLSRETRSITPSHQRPRELILPGASPIAPRRPGSWAMLVAWRPTGSRCARPGPPTPSRWPRCTSRTSASRAMCRLRATSTPCPTRGCATGPGVPGWPRTSGAGRSACCTAPGCRSCPAPTGRPTRGSTSACSSSPRTPAATASASGCSPRYSSGPRPTGSPGCSSTPCPRPAPSTSGWGSAPRRGASWSCGSATEVGVELGHPHVVARRVAEPDVDAVHLLLGLPDELDAPVLHRLVGGPEVVGGEEDRAGQALADQVAQLLVRRGVDQRRAGDAHEHDGDVGLPGRPHRQPAEVAHLGHGDVAAHLEAHLVGPVLQRLVLVVHPQLRGGDGDHAGAPRLSRSVALVAGWTQFTATGGAASSRNVRTCGRV